MNALSPTARQTHDPTLTGAERIARAERDRAELEQLGDQIAGLSAHIHAPTYRLLTLIREFD